jgi:hypothetical protein
MADPRERFNDLDESMRLAVDRHLSTVWTAMPVRVTEDSEGHTCELQITIQGRDQSREGQVNNVDIAPLGKVPLHYSAGGGFTITHPIKKDDEGIAIFASRCIDGWWDKGGQQPEPYPRRHKLSDAIYIPGVRNKPRQLGGNPDDPQSRNGQQSKPPSTNSVQIRTDTGEFYIELTDKDVNIVCTNCTITAKETVKVICKNADVEAEENVTVKCKEADVTASTKVRLDTPRVEITGSLYIDGDIHWHGGTITSAGQVTMDGSITASGQIRSGSVGLTSHHHTGVQGGTSTTGPPVG